jgi:5-methylcytosine-specific restriction endonuclease McrA
MRVIKRVNRKWRQPRFRKRVLFNRDNWKCQYCNAVLVAKTVTIEHVFPRSRGGTNSWTNCVTACKPCNRKKGNRTPEEAGMKLLSKPVTPSAMDFWDAMKSNVWHKDWDLFLQKNH